MATGALSWPPASHPTAFDNAPDRRTVRRAIRQPRAREVSVLAHGDSGDRRAPVDLSTGSDDRRGAGPTPLLPAHSRGGRPSRLSGRPRRGGGRHSPVPPGHPAFLALEGTGPRSDRAVHRRGDGDGASG